MISRDKRIHGLHAECFVYRNYTIANLTRRLDRKSFGWEKPHDRNYINPYESSQIPAAPPGGGDTLRGHTPRPPGSQRIFENLQKISCFILAYFSQKMVKNTSFFRVWTKIQICSWEIFDENAIELNFLLFLEGCC